LFPNFPFQDLIYSGVAIFIYFILSFIFLSPYAEIIRVSIKELRIKLIKSL
jgi:hypothetical protein